MSGFFTKMLSTFSVNIKTTWEFIQKTSTKAHASESRQLDKFWKDKSSADDDKI